MRVIDEKIIDCVFQPIADRMSDAGFVHLVLSKALLKLSVAIALVQNILEYPKDTIVGVCINFLALTVLAFFIRMYVVRTFFNMVAEGAS